MTGADLAICRRFSAALAALDPDAALADAHPEIELHMPRETVHGAAGLRTLLTPPPLDYLERTIILDDVIDVGERAVALGRIQLRWRDADEPADTQHVGAVLELREGRVIRWRAFPDPDSAFAAAAPTFAGPHSAVGPQDASTAPLTRQ
jgi:limonene-1,2-epoxide hydrolase